MKSINFTDQELDHLQRFYLLELAEAEKEVEEIKAILSKLGESKQTKSEDFSEKKTAKRGRKPKVVVEEIPVPEVKRGRKPKVKVEEVIKKDLKPKKEKVKPVKEEPVIPVVEPKPAKSVAPKKTAKQKKQIKKKGVSSVKLPVNEPVVETTIPPVTDQATE